MERNRKTFSMINRVSRKVPFVQLRAISILSDRNFNWKETSKEARGSCKIIACILEWILVLIPSKILNETMDSVSSLELVN